MPILSVEGLVKIYGRRRVVDGVDFEVNRGEISGLLGPNGALVKPPVSASPAV